MESVAWAYNGSYEVVATITGAEVGVSYTLFSWDPVSTAPTEEATSGTLVLTVSDIGGVGGGLNSWLVYVQKESTLDIVATTVLEWGGNGVLAAHRVVLRRRRHHRRGGRVPSAGFLGLGVLQRLRRLGA